MVDVKPMLRPSAKELLDSDLYLDKDQVCYLSVVILSSIHSFSQPS